MRNITVLDILNLPIMANASLKAGHNGLKNIVSYVNVLDNYYDPAKPEETPINYGQNFYLTSMYFGIDNEDYIVTVMQHFADMNVSAVCIIDNYMTELPAAAYAIANEHRIPIIFINADIPYALIISSIMSLKLSYQDSELKEKTLYELTSPNCPQSRKEVLIHQLNTNLIGEVISFYCQDMQNKDTPDLISSRIYFLDKVRNNKAAFACCYKDGIILVKSFPSLKKGGIDAICKEIVSGIRSAFPGAAIGISNPLPLLQLGESVTQSYAAAMSGIQNTNGITYFKDIGISQFLLRIISRPELEEYYDSLISPILKYDKKYNSNLLETLKIYVECNLDHIKTGELLHIHKNTVRYRLNKIKELIPYGMSPLDFNFSLYMIYRILKIKSILET